jgi:transposase
MTNIGCDIGKSNLDVYFKGKLKRYRNDKTGISEFLKDCLVNDESRVILEPSGGYEKDLLMKLHELKIAVSVVNPYYVRNFARSYRDLAKTDRIDAKMLSEYGEKMNPRNQERKAEYCFELEALTERRVVLIETVKAEKLRLEKNPGKRTIQSIESHIKFLQVEIKKIESEIRKIMETKADAIKEILQSEKGIGEQTAAILIASLPELGKLENRQIAKLVGLAPMACESGKMRSARHIRGGRMRVRNALFMASISAIRSNPKVSAFYKNLRANGKPALVALIAVAHKLLIILNAKMRAFLNNKNSF